MKFPSAFAPFPFTTGTAPSSARSKRLKDSSPPPMFAIATMDRSFPVASTDQGTEVRGFADQRLHKVDAHSILPNRRISSYRPIHHKKGDDEDDKPAASKQKPEPVKTPPAQEQPAAKEKRIGRKR
jgi:hypothetical protein